MRIKIPVGFAVSLLFESLHFDKKANVSDKSI
jgi:hypothetical protein